VPKGCGAVGIPADNAEGHVPMKCCCTPDVPNFMLSPNSFKSLLGKHYNGYKLECNDDKKTFRLSLKHKMRKSECVLLRGTTGGGLCYARLAVPPMPDKAAISMAEDHPKNSHWHEMKLDALSAKVERSL